MVTNLLFKDQPELMQELEFTLIRVNGWNHDGYLLYGLDMRVLNAGDTYLEAIYMKITDVSPSSDVVLFSDDQLNIFNLAPFSSQIPTFGYYFNRNQENEIYVGNFYVYLESSVSANTTITVNFDIVAIYEQEQIETEISRTFQTLHNHSFVSKIDDTEQPIVFHPAN